MVFHFEQSRKNGPVKLRSDFRAAVSMKNRLHHESGEQIEERFIQINKDDGIHLQAHRGETNLNGIGSELTKFLNCLNLLLLQMVSSPVDSDPL